MNYEPKIIEFIEGTLSPEEEQSFLYDLMENEESRKSFQEVLRIEKSFKSNFPRKKPSESLKKSVFASAGFSKAIPKNHNRTIKNGFIKSNFTYITHFLSAVAGVIIAGLLFFNDSDDKQSNKYENNRELTIEMKVPAQTFERNQTRRVNIQTDNIPSKEKEFAFNKDMHHNSNKEKVFAGKANISMSQIVDKRIGLDYEKKYPLLDYKINKMNHKRQLIIDQKSNLLSGFYFEFGGSESFFTQKTQVEPAEVGSFINKSIGAFYKLNDFMNIGILVSNENFYLDYQSDAFPENRYRVEQQPVILSGNLMLEFNKSWKYGIIPFVRINSGMSKTGPILGGSVGINYNISDNLYLYGNLGYKILYYTHEKNDFSAEKYSINYGIKYHINN